jgi:two-component system sensor kinase FixL
VRTALVDGHIEVAVADRGKGIATDDLERVFQPFVTTKADGMGLGLAVCRTIVTAHAGRIWAARNADAGMTFHFTVPVSRAQIAASA